jgi:hypothetical protein
MADEGNSIVNEIQPNDRVAAYGRIGTVIQLRTVQHRASADVQFDGYPFTELYPLDSLTVMLRSQIKP